MVKIVNNRLTLSGVIGIPDHAQIRVISILGKARMGKSTFLNAMVSWLKTNDPTTESAPVAVTGTPRASAPPASSLIADPVTLEHGTFQPPFATQDDDNHCTRGIDYYYCESKAILLLDCQGLALEDSSHDPMLLLFTYLISDRIIFNERMMLQNEALKLMEPICTFMNYLEDVEIEKPKLFFRISDGDLVRDPQVNLKKVMARYNDQYQSIRDSVAHLFQPEIGIIKTDTLDRITKAAVQSGDYDALFSETSLGFHKAVNAVMSNLPKGHPASIWMAQVPKFVDQINNNTKISIDKLDIVTQTSKIEMMEWERNIPAEMFFDMIVDGLQKTYELNVEPRKAFKKDTLTKFKKRFKALPENLTKGYYDSIKKKLSAPIDKATRISTDMAEAGIANEVQAAQKTRGFTMTNTDESFIYIEFETILNDCLPEFKALKAVIASRYEPVREKYATWMKDQENALRSSVEAVVEDESKQYATLNTLCTSSMSTFVTRCKEGLKVATKVGARAFIYVPVGEIIADLRDLAATALANQMIFTPTDIQVNFTDGNMITRSTKQAEMKIPISHNLVKDMYNAFVSDIAEDAEGTLALQEAVIARKEDILYCKRFGNPNDVCPKISDIQFVTAHLGNRVLGTMTAKTYNDIYRKLVDATADAMIRKMYIQENSGDVRENTLPYAGLANCSTITMKTPEDCLMRLFEHNFDKVCAAFRSKGGNLPQKTDLASLEA